MFSLKSQRSKLRLKLFWKGIGLLTLTVLLLVCVVLYHFQRFHTTADKVILHSDLRNQAVIIPFQLKNNLISVYAEFAHRKKECIIDTGSAAILWPQDAGLPARKTLSWGYAKDALGNQVKLTEYTVGSVKIGNYELLGVPTLAVSGDSSSSRSYPDLRRVCDLGNSAFSETIMTIDYKKRILILQSSSYDPIQHCSKRCFVFPFQWKSRVPGASNFGYLVIAAKTLGHPLSIVVDTGDSSPATTLTDSYAKAHLSEKKLNRNWSQKTAFGETKADWLPSLKIFVPNARSKPPGLVISQPAVILPDQHDGADAIIGYAVLKDYRVTIDYPRQKILLEPN